MARVGYTANTLANLERAFEFPAAHDPGATAGAAAAIRDAVEALSRHPLIGRPADEGLRELVISYGKTGYVGRSTGSCRGATRSGSWRSATSGSWITPRGRKMGSDPSFCLCY